MSPVPLLLAQPAELQLIGKGRVTLVYRGTFNNVSVAVKKIEIARLSKLVNVSEIESVTKQLNHPNVRSLLHIQQDADFKYFILELCSNTLSDYCKAKYSGPILEPIDGLTDMALGLEYIHSKKLVHGCLKPSNILISYNEESSKVILKIGDYGFSQLTSSVESSSFSGISSSNNYLAPEILAQGEDSYSFQHLAGDVFALGCIFYEFLTKGSHPFGRSFMIPSNILSATYQLKGKFVDSVGQWVKIFKFWFRLQS